MRGRVEALSVVRAPMPPHERHSTGGVGKGSQSPDERRRSRSCAGSFPLDDVTFLGDSLSGCPRNPRYLVQFEMAEALNFQRHR